MNDGTPRTPGGFVGARVDARDPETLLAEWTAAYGPGVTAQVAGISGRWRLARQATAEFALDRSELDARIVSVCEPGNRLFVAAPTRGALVQRNGREEVTVGPGEVCLFDGRGATAMRGERVHALALVLDLDLLDRLAPAGSAGWALPARLPALKAPASAVGLWWQTVRYVEDVMLAHPASAGDPVIAREAGRMLAAVTLALFESPDARLAESPTVDAHPASLRRAVAYIESATDSVDVIDVAEAARVSARSLQLAFRRHLGTTPSGYDRTVRLDRARRDLLHTSLGDGVTVGQVAADHGFGHAGRFSALYRAVYGENPAETLQRSHDSGLRAPHPADPPPVD